MVEGAAKKRAGKGEAAYLCRTYNALVQKLSNAKCLKKLAPLPGYVSNSVSRSRPAI